MSQLLSLLVTAAVLPAVFSAATADAIRPLVLWHGMGDSASSPGMLEFAEIIKGIHPGIFVHSVYLAEDNQADSRAGLVRQNPSSKTELSYSPTAILTVWERERPDRFCRRAACERYRTLQRL
jgi:hypothetical protein